MFEPSGINVYLNVAIRGINAGGNKLRTTRTFKHSYSTEPYVNVTTSKKYRSAYAKFRCGVASHKIESCRYSKTEFLIIRSQFSKVTLPKLTVTVGDTEILSSDKARNLSVIFDSFMNLEPHITQVCRVAYMHHKYWSFTVRTYFINIGHSLSEQIHATRSSDEYLSNRTNTIFNFTEVTEECIDSIIKNMKSKSSTGYDNISNKLVKSAKDVLIKPLTLLMNQIIHTGEFPNQLKIAKVKPLFNKMYARRTRSFFRNKNAI